MKEYLGMYLGLVVQNNDPEYRGRVKVYVPHIQANVYQQWYEDITDKSFNFPGKNIYSDLEAILPELKNILPWAENAMPSLGATGSGRYNAHDQIGTVSDSNRSETLTPLTHTTDLDKKYKLNDEHIGEKPGKVYESHETWVSDAFTNIDNPDHVDGATNLFEELPVGDRLNGVNRPNQFAWNYQPNTYSNCAKGGFSIPNVGSHVWVFFQGGDPLQPVVFATSFGKEDWQGIYESSDAHGQDYPGTYENMSNKDEQVYDNNTETYRNKFVINQKGGALEFVNTDNREILKMTHYSGSFLEFNNHTNIEFATKNSQRLVQEDQYDTVKGFRNVYTERDLDYIIRGDHYHKVGYQNFNHHAQWREAMRPLANIKALFDIKRVMGGFHLDEFPITGEARHDQFVNLQVRAGVPAPCPVCMDTGRVGYWRVGNQMLLVNRTDTSSMGNGATYATLSPMGGAPGHFNPTGRGDLSWPVPNSITYKLFPMIYQDSLLHEQQAIDPLWVLRGPGFIFGKPCPACNNVDGFAATGVPPTPGLSPSSMEGSWLEEEQKNDALLQATLKGIMGQLAPLESEMGLGGSEIINIAKHKIENVGLVMNDFPSIRVDPLGKMLRSEVIVHPGGVFVNQTPSPLVESVHVDDLPGGSYSMNVANRWNVHVGAGGITMKSFGRVEIGGSQLNAAGDQVNIGAQHDMNIDGGKRLSMVADIISIRQRERGQVLVDSNLGVTQNVVIGGGLHVEGELTCQHITAPVEIQETEVARIYSKLLTGLTFNCTLVGGTHDVSPHGVGHPTWTGATLTLNTDSNDDHVVDYGHSHLFKNAAMHLMDSNSAVRATGEDCNEKNERADANHVEITPASAKVKRMKYTEKIMSIDPRIPTPGDG